MLTCPNPTCRKSVPAGARECPRCRADLSLLVSYVEDLRGGLVQAEALTRAGELGQAVWTYLEVLEVDPDNATARRQVGQVVAAVRQFDRAAPGRRWFHRLQRQARFRQWLSGAGRESADGGWFSTIVWIVLVLAALVIGYVFGLQQTPPEDARAPLPRCDPSEQTLAPLALERQRRILAVFSG
jgi:hypothetical protein